MESKLNGKESLAHAKWACKYHVVFIPKYRRQALFRELRTELGGVFRRMAEQQDSRVEEGHLMEEHVHMLLSIPPKRSVAQVFGCIKGRPRFTLPGPPWERGRASRVSISGHGGTSCQRWASRRGGGLLSEARSRRVNRPLGTGA